MPVASGTTRRHSRDDPREDVGEDVGVRVGVVECQLYSLDSLRIVLSYSELAAKYRGTNPMPCVANLNTAIEAFTKS